MTNRKFDYIETSPKWWSPFVCKWDKCSIPKYLVSFSVVFLLQHICVLFRLCSFLSALVILFSFLFLFEFFQCRSLKRGKRLGLKLPWSEINDRRPVTCEHYRETRKTANSAGRKRLYCCTSCWRSPQKLTSPNAEVLGFSRRWAGRKVFSGVRYSFCLFAQN